jgi:N-acetylneuraminate lyase
MDPKIASFRITGLCAANFQAFTPSGAIDTSAVAAHAANLRSQGVSSVFTCGTTGEGSKLSVAERKTMTEAWVAAAGGLDIIAHVGAESLADACELAAHAQASGAVAIGVIPPCYVKPGDVSACIAWVEKIASFAPALPVYYCALRARTRGACVAHNGRPHPPLTLLAHRAAQTTFRPCPA